MRSAARCDREGTEGLPAPPQVGPQAPSGARPRPTRPTWCIATRSWALSPRGLGRWSAGPSLAAHGARGPCTIVHLWPALRGAS